jgi:hypothetical protein
MSEEATRYREGQSPVQRSADSSSAVGPAYNGQKKDEGLTLKEKIIFSLLGLGLFGGSVWLIRKIILKRIANKEETSTLDEGSVATSAKQIKMAFENDGWPGTNTKELRRILIEIPSKKDTSRVAKSYTKLYNRSMYTDMKDELQSTEYNEMLAIVAEKPDKGGKKTKPVDMSKKYDEWAKRLKAAFDKSYGPFPGTDEDAIKSVFNEIPSQAAFVEVGNHYAKLYGGNMTEDLKSESEFGQYSDWMKIITSKAKE